MKMHPGVIYLFIYTLYNEGKTHLANIKLFNHVALSKETQHINNKKQNSHDI